MMINIITTKNVIIAISFLIEDSTCRSPNISYIKIWSMYVKNGEHMVREFNNQ